MLFEAIILRCLNQIKTERTIFSIFHLLKGKKSIQTIQDIRLYQLENYYGIYPSLLREHFEKKMSELHRQGLIEKVSDNPLMYKPKQITHMATDIDAYQFYGITYSSYSKEFYHRLLLMIQTVTNTKMGHFSFIPVVDDTATALWVKSIYKKIKGNETNVLNQIYDELYTLLTPFPDQGKEIYVHRLTGYKRYGLSLEQLVMQYKRSKDDILLILMAMNHQMIYQLKTDKNNFPFLAQLVSDLSSTPQMTTSSYHTYQLMKKGYSMEKIAQIRNLKLSTIYDHVVEIAISVDDFPLHDFVSTRETEEINHAIITSNSYKLKDIKKAVGDSITYFQIRLVLAVKDK